MGFFSNLLGEKLTWPEVYDAFSAGDLDEPMSLYFADAPELPRITAPSYVPVHGDPGWGIIFDFSERTSRPLTPRSVLAAIDALPTDDEFVIRVSDDRWHLYITHGRRNSIEYLGNNEYVFRGALKPLGSPNVHNAF